MQYTPVLLPFILTDLSLYPAAFIRQMEALLGPVEWANMAAALLEPPPVSIRLHARRAPRDPAALPLFTAGVPWHPQGRYLAERPVFTLDPLFHAGAYYVQEASSMFVGEVLRQTGRAGQSGLRVLDMCAAPGGKTTLMYDTLGAGLMVANEIVPQRAAVLRENTERWGISDGAVLSADPSTFEQLPEWFDLILTDAPCSGEGMFRKDPASIGEWSPENVTTCTLRQQNILESATAALAPGGLLLYSTCTYNRAENEENVLRHCKQYGLKRISLRLPPEWGITETDGGYQFLPHKTRGEGFFIAVLEKPAADIGAKVTAPNQFRQIAPLPKKQAVLCAPWLAQPDSVALFTTPSGEILALPAERMADFRTLDSVFRNKWFGVPVGTLKGSDFVPAHALALSPLLSPDIPRAELSREQALTFLKKETFDPPPAKGWVAAAFQGLPLGWMKVLPNRMNNYLPAERRIRMNIDAER